MFCSTPALGRYCSVCVGVGAWVSACVSACVSRVEYHVRTIPSDTYITPPSHHHLVFFLLLASLHFPSAPDHAPCFADKTHFSVFLSTPKHQRRHSPWRTHVERIRLRSQPPLPLAFLRTFVQRPGQAIVKFRPLCEISTLIGTKANRKDGSQRSFPRQRHRTTSTLHVDFTRCERRSDLWNR